MAAIDYINDVVRAAFVKLEARATAAETAGNGAFTVSQLSAANRVYQRGTTTGGGQGKGTGTIPVTVNVSAVGIPKFRIRSSDGSTILQPATALPAFTATGSQTLNIAGVDARLGWFYVDLSADGTTWQNGTTLVGMGRVVAASGQSLAVRMFGRMDSQTTTMASLGVAVSPNGSVYGTYYDSQRSVSSPAWALPADGSNYDSTFAAEFLRLQVAAAGVNCGLVAAHPVGGQSITTFIPGGANNAAMRSRLDEAGGYETFVWMQGHSDVGTSTSVYQTNLSSLFTDVTAHNAVRGSSFDRLVNDLPNISSNSYPTPAAREALHVAVAAWCGSNGATYVQPRDLDLIDGIHESQAGAITLARHFDRASRPGLGLVHGDVGPSFGTPTRLGVTITIPVSLPSGATALSAVGSPASRFSVFATGTTSSPLALDSTTPITVGSSSITLKLASDPGNATALDIYFGYPTDPTITGGADMIYDNNIDGDGITFGRQLMPSLTPAVAAATSTGGAVASFVGTPLTMTSAVYEADDSTGFGQRLVGGYGATSGNSPGTPSLPFSVGVRFLAPTALPSGVQIIVSQGNRFCIGEGTDGRLTCQISTPGGTTGNPNSVFIGGGSFTGGGTLPLINDGTSHWVFLVVDSTSATIYLDGTQVGVLTGISTRVEANQSPFGVRTHGPLAGSFTFGGKVSEVALFGAAVSPKPPTTALSNSTPNIVELWHFDGNGSAASA